MIKQYMEKLDFPTEAIDELYECYKKMVSTEGVLCLMEDVKEQIFCGNDRSFTSGLEAVAKAAGVNRYQSDMVMLLSCIPSLKYLYHSHGIDEAVLWDSMSDLRCKLYECKAVKGVWGNFVAYWYGIFFRLRCFKLGRIEFEKVTFPLDSYKNLSKKGDAMLNCHIPSAGPLKEEQVYDSLRRAYDFFPEMRRDGILPILCHSWLLDPKYKDNVFPSGTNTRNFIDLVELIEAREDTNYADLWRVFNVEYTEGCLASLPEDTSMRKRMKEHLLAGNKMGDAYGIILFDGEKVLTKQ